MIRNEAARQADVAKRRKELTDELNEIAGPVLEFRKIETSMRELQTALQSLGEHDSATKAHFRRELERTMPDELGQVLRAARAELSARRRPTGEPPEALRQLADLKTWHVDVEAALGKPDVSSAQLKEMATAGRALLSAEGTVARV
jgi:hypothetical protein